MSIYLVFATTTAAYASSSIGGWTAVDTVISGATTTINATKTVGGKLMQSAVTVAPSATKVGKHLIRGGGVAALALAVPQLLGDGVDWVLDPENNAVKYKNPDYVAGYPAGTTLYATIEAAGYFPTKLEACQAHVAYLSATIPTYKIVFISASNPNFCEYSEELKKGGGYRVLTNSYLTKIADGAGAGAGDEYKYIPIEAVAEQVISEAESGNVPSQEALKAAALEGFAAGEHDAALEAGATESEAGTDNPPDTADPNNPAEPFDPSSIINAIKSLGAILTGILSSITSLSDMFGDSPSNAEDTEVPIDDAPPIRAPTEFDTEYVNFGGQCPSFGSHDISVGSVSVPLTIDITPLCELAELVRPAVIGGAYLVATGLVVAAIREA